MVLVISLFCNNNDNDTDSSGNDHHNIFHFHYHTTYLKITVLLQKLHIHHCNFKLYKATHIKVECYQNEEKEDLM